ncbi:MAG: zf-HC2 domain-containing protein [Chloroflexota bacterium]|nr:zf-HC2 domain-containing protein [Chloroflexota bacterium]
MSEDNQTLEDGPAYGTCREMLSDLSAYLDGDLDDALCLEIERHMTDCEDCRVVVDTLRKTVMLYHRLPPEPLPDDVEDRLFKQLDLSEYLNS